MLKGAQEVLGDIFRTKVYFRNQKIGLKLAGSFETNKSNTSNEVVILVHGMLGDKNNLFFPDLAAAIIRQTGRSVLRYDCRSSGVGDSEGEFDYGGYYEDVDDLRWITEKLREEGYSISALIGHSKGANLVLMYASQYTDIPLIVPIAGRFIMDAEVPHRFSKEDLIKHGYGEWKANGRKWIVTRSSYNQRASIPMKKICQKVKSSVLLVHGDADDIVPFADSLKAKEVIPSCTFVALHDDHIFLKTKDQLITKVLSWLSVNLELERKCKL
eukprot:TRINITY_DN12988_c0_g1_i1.p1 TRINITY_DN12988_c0_g1~~TRINITY_DN12988_c0_g1_i1.p1  ORF type:complete len:271 (+),score=50.18 TRINITY_DN12988_c0_g1_i1:43-855(+)